MASYTMFPHKHFAVVVFNNPIIELQEAIAINEAYKNDTHYSNIHYLIIIMTGCKPNFTEKDLPRITELYTSNTQKNNHKTSVWIVDEPLLTAFAHIFVNYTDEKSYYCSTLNKAYILLNPKNISYMEFLDFIKQSQSNK